MKKKREKIQLKYISKKKKFIKQYMYKYFKTLISNVQKFIKIIASSK